MQWNKLSQINTLTSLQFLWNHFHAAHSWTFRPHMLHVNWNQTTICLHKSFNNSAYHKQHCIIWKYMFNPVKFSPVRCSFSCLFHRGRSQQLMPLINDAIATLIFRNDEYMAWSTGHEVDKVFKVRLHHNDIHTAKFCYYSLSCNLLLGYNKGVAFHIHS